MTMIALMSAILVFSPQNRFQIAFKNLKASWQIFSSDLLSKFWKQIAGKNSPASFQKFESERANFFQRFAFKVLKANRWKKFAI